jgi:uncharacterized protein YigE (DUF2233 family)
MRVWYRLATILLMLLLAACAAEPLEGSFGSAPAGGAQSVDAQPHAAPWQPIDAAMELRTMRLSTGAASTFVTVVRFDPAAYTIRVKYDVQNAGTIREWFDALQPLAVINGGYFDQAGRPTALVIFDGIRRGESYAGFGGMVVVNEAGQFELRSLRQQPYDPSENLQQAMQSAPMLIQPGGEISELDGDDNDRSRRSVIARDRQGRLLLIASDTSALTLPELAQSLKNSDLDLDAALNLDGGRSTGLYVRTEQASVQIDSLEKLPLVLAVERP